MFGICFSRDKVHGYTVTGIPWDELSEEKAKSITVVGTVVRAPSFVFDSNL